MAHPLLDHFGVVALCDEHRGVGAPQVMQGDVRDSSSFACGRFFAPEAFIDFASTRIVDLSPVVWFAEWNATEV